jgi:hypothetical protein
VTGAAAGAHLQENRLPEVLMLAERVAGAAAAREGRELPAAEEVEDLDKELVREQAEQAQACARGSEPRELRPMEGRWRAAGSDRRARMKAHDGAGR